MWDGGVVALLLLSLLSWQRGSAVVAAVVVDAAWRVVALQIAVVAVWLTLCLIVLM